MKYFLAIICGVIIVGCGSKDDAIEPSEIGVAPEPGPAVVAESLPLPEGFPEVIPVMDGMLITSSKVNNAETNEFEVIAISPEHVDTVFEYYLNAFEVGDWTEDMVMTHEGNNQASYIKRNLLVFMDAQTTEQGTVVTLTTGTSD